MPLNNFREYSSVTAVHQHFIDIDNQFKKANELQKVIASDKVINLTPTLNTPLTKSRVDTRTINKIADNAKVVEQLTEQNAALSNMRMVLNTKFDAEGENSAQIAALMKNIRTLQIKVQESLRDAMSVAQDKAKELIQQKTMRVAASVKKYLDKSFVTEGVITLSSGVVKKKVNTPLLDAKTDTTKTQLRSTPFPVFACFISYTNVKNAKGEVEPKIVIAISENEDKIYINPGLVSIFPVGQLKMGYPLPSDEKAAVAYAIKKVATQMEMDSQLSAISPKAVPFQPEHVNLKTDKTKVNKAEFAKSTIEITFNKTITTEKQAEAAAQECFILIKRAAVQSHARAYYKDRIVYETHKVGAVLWGVTFKFAQGNQWNGRTLTDDEDQSLSNIFNDREMKTIREALNNIK